MNSFKQLPASEKPRERFLKYGKENISNEDLIAIILKTGTKNKSVKQVVHCLLLEIKNVFNLRRITLNQLIAIKGIGEVKAITLLAALELGRRIYQEQEIEKEEQFLTPKTIYNYFKHLFLDKKQEEFYVIYLDNQKRFLDKKMLFKGTVNSSIVHPREIFKEAYLLSASYIICLHNHPSGDLKPSFQDKKITTTINTIGEIHGIILLDHLIITENKYYSFYENDLL